MLVCKLDQRSRILTWIRTTLAITVLVFSIPVAHAADGTGSGYEAGISYERAVQHFPGLVREELFLRIPFSWRHDISQDYTLRSYLVVAVGDMGRDGHDPTIISVGGQLRLDPRRPDGRVYYLLGFSPTLLTNTTFGNESLGTSLEFTTQLAVGVYLGETRRAAVELSLQHTSNGGMGSHNPGVNTLGIATVYRF